MFREVKKDEGFAQIEDRVLALWDLDHSFQKSIDLREGAEAFTFYDGPPFATGLPHYGHLLAGTIKDIVPRYWTMKGKRVPRRFGWDCHGLPIESLIQNDLKLSGVAEIKAFGEDNFNEACRGAVLKYTGEWRKTVRRMGRWVDFDKDYKTMDPGFMESVWWVFKQCWDKGLIYQGYRIQPYSPALATPLSNFETNQGYQDRQDPSVTLLFPLEGRAESLLVWTTTPWTLPSNLAIAVGADIDYVLVEATLSTGEKRKVWLAESRLNAYFPVKKGAEPVAILQRCKGADLVGLHYEPLFRIADAYATPEEQAKRYTIYAADFVSTEDGAGAVHIAPSFGEEDFQLGAQVGLGLFDPLDVEGKFTSKVSQWEGVGAKDADKGILHFLKDQGRIFKHETFVHSYPHCYRTGVPLLYRALKTWFLALDKEITSREGETKTLKQWMIDSNQQITWVPDHIKSGRFGKWLDNARDWNISRNRFWGTPLPVWIAEDGEMLCVGSIAELAELSGTTLTDLHKHFVDKVTIVKDGKTFTRTSEVFDCWFESGSMPYAQKHFPFENNAEFEGGFPADFIAEGLDQTRGWFYTLTVLGAALFQKPAFKNVIVNGIILAEDGTKMSKSKRNYPDPNELIGRTGADAVRLFMINSAALKAEDLRFSEEGVKQIVKSVMLPLWNAVGFFISNHNADYSKGQLNWKPTDKWASDNELDRWIIAVLQELAAKVEIEMAAYRLYNVVPAVVAFVDDLTNWYVRRSRRRFWKSENDGDKTAAYATLYKVLVDFSKMLAPFLPLLSEEIYQILVREVVVSSPESVHHCEFPSADAALANADLVRRMSMVRGVVEMGRAIRAAKEIKNRQPLGVLTLVPHSAEERSVAESMRELILEELNVRELKFLDDETALVSLSAKPNFNAIKAKGPDYAKNMKAISTALSKLDTDGIRTLQNGGSIVVEGLPVDGDCLMIARTVPEGVAVEADAHFTVALDLHITPELKRACMARELVNRIQTRRKEMDYEIVQRIAVTLATSSAELHQAVEENREYIMGETQANSLLFVDSVLADAVDTDADGEAVRVGVAKG
jgi:isoleucyl-tRNA synthetase